MNHYNNISIQILGDSHRSHPVLFSLFRQCEDLKLVTSQRCLCKSSIYL